jgi:hypothetical protein
VGKTRIASLTVAAKVTETGLPADPEPAAQFGDAHAALLSQTNKLTTAFHDR